MKKKLIGLLILLIVSVVTYSSDTELNNEITNSKYNTDFQLNFGYDIMRNISKGPLGPESDKGSMDQGFTIGAEYLLNPINSKLTYGLGFEYRSKLKNKTNELNTSVPLFLSVRYPFYHDRFYLIGRGGYNFTQDGQDESTTGGHYLAAGIGKKLGYIHLEVLWENMGYKFENNLGKSGYGSENSIGIKFGFKLGDIYDALTNSSEDLPEPAPEPKIIEPEVIKPKVIIEEKVIEKTVIRGQHSNFALDRSSLSTDEKIQLDRFKKEELDGAKKLIITGYTDSSGSAAHNLKLSEERAESVKDYLQIPSNIEVQVIGMGEKEPLGGSPYLDRRVEIQVIK